MRLDLSSILKNKLKSNEKIYKTFEQCVCDNSYIYLSQMEHINLSSTKLHKKLQELTQRNSAFVDIT